ncbi:GLE1-domain-containing protein [Meredithblackwellia eburnea MCA 4105]
MKFGFEEFSSDSDSDQGPSTSALQRRGHSSSSKTPSTPFTPKQVHVRTPLQPSNARRAKLFSTSAARRGAQDSSDDDSSDPEFSEEEEDSEEEEWPVGPVGSIGMRGWRRPGETGLGKGKGKANDPSQRVYGGPDDFDLWDQQQRAQSWAAANKSFKMSLSRSMSTSPTSSQLVQRQDASSLHTLLETLTIAHSKSQALLRNSFEQRNKALWDSIEASILAAEKEEEGKRRVLEEQRRRGEEAERKAKEMREAEERKKEEERKAVEKKKADEEKRVLEEKKQVELAKAKREQEAKEALERAKRMSEADGGSPQADWEKWTMKMTEIKTLVLPVVSQNPAYRKACFAAKRAITPKIGQLTASASAISRIIQQLHEILTSLRPPAGQETSTQPYTWALNHLSKALVKQAETEVTAKLGTAYPLGRIVIGLLGLGHTELGDVLMARLVKKCFWITGWWPPKQPGQSDEAHQKALGHAPPSAGETLVQYSQRMSGLVALYAAIVQTSPLERPQGPLAPNILANVPPHFRPSAGWKWLVLILRPPLVGLEPTPLLLCSFLEISGEAMLAVYGKQMGKFLEVLLREGVREGKAGFSEKSKSSTVRLMLWLEEWEKTGRVEKIMGKEVDP